MGRGGEKTGSEADRLVESSLDYLPHAEMMPSLTEGEVESFVALGVRARIAIRAGNDALAEESYRAQTAIFGPNFEPHVSLAILAAKRGDERAALDHLEAAVVRGFTDMRRIAEAEAWQRIGRPPRFRKLIDALPGIERTRRDWIRWNRMSVQSPPADLDSVVRRQAELHRRVERMAPALGPRLTGLWHSLIDRAAAAMLHAHLERETDTDDLRATAERLLALYAGGPLESWERLESEPARKLAELAELLLERYPDSAMRPVALLGRALARSSGDPGQGTEEATESIVAALTEIVTRYPESAQLAPAVVGLVRTEWNVGRREGAAERYGRFLEAHAGEPALLRRVRTDLGELALLAGGLPRFEARTLDGSPVSAESLRGRVAVIDFWATWCGPCTEEMPSLRKLQERYGDRIALVGVSLDDALAPDELRRWIEERAVPGKQVCDGRGWDSELLDGFGVRSIPFDVVIAADGSVMAVNAYGRELKKTVRAALDAE